MHPLRIPLPLLSRLGLRRGRRKQSRHRQPTSDDDLLPVVQSSD
jgi:hypothetical protein